MKPVRKNSNSISMTTLQIDGQKEGVQRHSISRLQQWEALGYGMFIHFGMSTFDGCDFSKGDKPSMVYAPDKLDVSQWVSVARDAGMKYAILTTKHHSGHCLWPTKCTDYHVGTSRNTTDVVEDFVNACREKGVIPGFYYASWDNHNRFGSVTPGWTNPTKESFGMAFTTREYHDFQLAQIEELLTWYGPVGEVWIDIPQILPRHFRDTQYARIAALQPDAIVVYNSGIADGSKYSNEGCWPTDIITIERFLPNSNRHHIKWRELQGQNYYMPGEVCDTVGYEWFWREGDSPRSDAELLGMYLVSRSRNTNFVLNVGPDTHGLIRPEFVDALMRLRANIEKLGGFF